MTATLIAPSATSPPAPAEPVRPLASKPVTEGPRERPPAPAPPQHAPIADPGPLGLAAFAVTTFVLCVFDAEIADPSLKSVVLPLALFYGGLVQVLAGMWEFRKNNTFGAVAFSSYGAFWLAYAGYARVVAPELPAEQAHVATGVFLLAWTIFTGYMLLAALRINGLLIAVFSLLFLTFVLLTVGALGQSATITQIGGWVGILTAVGAFYGSAAGVTSSTWGRPILPVFPVQKG